MTKGMAMKTIRPTTEPAPSATLTILKLSPTATSSPATEASATASPAALAAAAAGSSASATPVILSKHFTAAFLTAVTRGLMTVPIVAMENALNPTNEPTPTGTSIVQLMVLSTVSLVLTRPIMLYV